MSIQLKKLFDETAEVYQLKLLAGYLGLDSEIVWVQYTEDIATSNFLRGSELIITTGLCSNDKTWVGSFIEELIARRAAGLIINTGKYIQPQELDEKIINMCNKNNFPLFIMPWRIHLADIMQDYLNRLFLATQEENDITELVRMAVFEPEKVKRCEKEFELHDLLGKPFYMSVFNFENTALAKRIKISLLLQTKNMLNQMKLDYIIFWQKNMLIMVIFSVEKNELQKIITQNIALYDKSVTQDKAHCGISSYYEDVLKIYNAFREAAMAAAVPETVLQKRTAFFDELGAYRLLFAASDKELLKKIHDSLLASLLEYDKKHHSQLYDTLHIYLFHNNSLKITADIAFTHRNTINYRMAKVRRILECDLGDAVTCFNLMMAFYIADYLKIMA
ncbi:PucR family transcriptional regulator [Pectinatus haikarae]|uniref:PucR family transcriptional regulator n=1 Tax=Pectinatus haikarae TaxID=349096 RepID=A0ABT9Y6Y8_9FIRM|nr:PucR family transcriptional regulator [Pectinatus haikarae]MDQ0203598.1 hypothetical protein [Pectinatus haikarae]